MYLDYSAYKQWMKCPWQWYELYVNRRRRRWPEKQRDDALAIGILVHGGLENWQKEQVPSIPQKVVETVGPTKEAYALAAGLVGRYAQTYPAERWPLILTEKPLVFPLIEGVDGVAKLDAYFYVPEPTTLEGGLPGMTIELSPGWWGHEYKTKDQGIDIGKYMQGWKTNRQADFQLLALTEEIKDGGIDLDYYPIQQVQGILVNVLEKTKLYVPRRKCRGCEGYADFAAWTPAGSKTTKGKEVSLYSCPYCKNIQTLAPVSTEERPQGEIFRMIVQRTPEELEIAEREIYNVALAMQGMVEDRWNQVNPLESTVAPNREACYDWRRGECPFYTAHTGGLSTLEDTERFEEAEDYLGLEEEAVA